MDTPTELQAALEQCPSVDAKIARCLRVSVPTVERWRFGVSRPAPNALPFIMAALRGLTDATHCDTHTP